MLKPEDLKSISKFFKGTEKKFSDGHYKLVIEGKFHFDLPKKCIPELSQGNIDLRVAISHGFPHKCPVAFIKDPSLRLFPHTRMSTGEICPPNDVKWASMPSLKTFLEYLNELLSLFAANCSEKPEDYYELPDFPVIGNKFGSYMVFECVDASVWLKSNVRVGLFSFLVDGNMLKVEQIDVPNNHDKKYFYGVFIWLPVEPIIKYKKPPINFGELNQILEKCGLGLSAIIDKMRQLNLKTVPVILGFPIKIKNKDTPIDVHWQLFDFSNEAFIFFLRKRRKKSKGKYKEQNYTDAMDDFLSCKSNEKISYRYSYNCSRQYLYSRTGPLIEDKSYAIFGCGAIGSHIAFQFARSGYKNLCLVDSDYVEPGNICRHLLDFNSVHGGKAIELSKKLRKINPWGNYIHYMKNIFSLNPGTEETEKISSCDIWVDAGLPSLASRYLSSLAAHYKKRMISCYITDKAKYFILIISGHECIPSNAAIEVKLMDLLKTADKEQLKVCFHALTNIEASASIRPNIGCYSRTFQASGAQISSIASIAFSIISNFKNIKSELGGIKIYAYDEHDFTYTLLLDKEIK